jgi:acetolactate synthase-1/2/3 large subunit
MGTSIPMAIGAALADPARPVVCVVGDGGLPPTVAELRACITRQLSVVVVFMTDGRFGSVLGVPGARGRVELAATVRPSSWLKTMAAFGCAVARAEDVDQLDRAVSAWDRRGPIFLELPFDATTYARSIESVR